MSKAVSGIFGGGKQPSSSSSQSSEPWAAVQPYLKDLFAKGQSAQQKMAGSVLPEQLTAGFNENQTSAQNSQLNLASFLQPQMGGNIDALNRGLNAADVGNNPYFTKAVDAAVRPMVQNFERQTMPQIGLNSIQNSGYGSSRQGIAEGLALSDLNTKIGDVSSSMASQAFEQGRKNELAALAQAPTTYASMLLPSTIQEGVGSQQQAMEQQFLNDALTKWNFERSKEMDSLQQYAQLLQGNFGGTSTGSTQQQVGSQDKFGKAIGTAATIASLFL